MRRHSGSLLSGSPPSEPFSFLKRATRFIISSRDQVRIVRQSFILRLLWGYYQPNLKLRSHLHLMVAGALAPVVLFAVISAALLVQHERRTIEREAIGRTRAAMSAIDAALLGHITTLKALAASKNLVTGNLEAFHEESQRILRTQPEWQNIDLATAAKEQLSDAILPYGKHAPFGGGEAAFDDARSRAQAIADEAGLALGEPVAIVEGASGGGVSPAYARELDVEAAADAPIEPGVQDVSATLTVTFAIA